MWKQILAKSLLVTGNHRLTQVPQKPAPQRAVFVADDDQGIWIVENPEAVRKYPAEHVELAGKFDSAKKTVYVEKIAPTAAGGAPQ